MIVRVHCCYFLAFAEIILLSFEFVRIIASQFCYEKQHKLIMKTKPPLDLMGKYNYEICTN